MGRLIILLGGNQGEIVETFQSVYSKLEKQIGSIVEYSGLYESEPWGFESELNFINQVVEVNCFLFPTRVLSIISDIESNLGRAKKSNEGYTSRPIDIDILFFDDIKMVTSDLTIPHPRLHERMFTLLPLTEKWADLIHPGNNKTIRQLTKECTDQGWVRKIYD